MTGQPISHYEVQEKLGGTIAFSKIDRSRLNAPLSQASCSGWGLRL